MGEKAHDKDQFEIVDERPFDGISVLFVFLFRCATLYESIADEAIDGGSRGRGKLGSVWGERAGPKDDSAWSQINSGKLTGIVKECKPTFVHY
jgi:hypothetical protein